MSKNPVKTIKEYIKKGYTIVLFMDSVKPVYAIEMFSQNDVKRFTVSMEDISIRTLHDAVRGL